MSRTQVSKLQRQREEYFQPRLGDWSGDLSQIVTAENGIVPFDGSRMLRFDGTFLNTSIDGFASDVWQLIDMSPFSTVVSTGLALASGSAYFNRIAGTNLTDTQFVVQIRAFSGLPSNFPSDASIAFAQGTLLSDGNPDTWESASVQLILPVSTTYVGFLVAGFENISRSGFPELDGHYADNVTFNVVPEPSTLLLLASGLAGLAAWRRKKAA